MRLEEAVVVLVLQDVGIGRGELRREYPTSLAVVRLADRRGGSRPS
jgi:hypothetical protein